MEQNRWDALQNAGIDLPDALRRMAGNTELLEKFLMRFPEDDNFGILGRALDGADWDTALIAFTRSRASPEIWEWGVCVSAAAEWWSSCAPETQQERGPATTSWPGSIGRCAAR